VLQLIAEGQSNKEIAVLRDVSVNTVHTQRNSVMAKLNIHKQADLVRYAIKAGIAKL
jgi:DNA-binding NarL/FixJ family response regulator